jgi:hypothetical protein
MPGKANKRRRKRVARGLAEAAAKDKEDIEFRETYEVRAREPVSKTMLVSGEGMDDLFKDRSE